MLLHQSRFYEKLNSFNWPNYSLLTVANVVNCLLMMKIYFLISKVHIPIIKLCNFIEHCKKSINIMHLHWKNVLIKLTTEPNKNEKF